MNINGKWNVYKVFPDEPVVQLTPSNGRYYMSCIRPDGAFAVCQGGSFDERLRIWKIDLNTKDMVPISPEQMSAWAPSYSWDGTHIVFAAETQAYADVPLIKDRPTFYPPDTTIPMSLWMCDDEGCHLKQLTSGDFMDMRPSFNPDERYVAFISKRSGIWKLWELYLKACAEPSMIEAAYSWAMRPWYSQDGQDIYFHTEIDKRHCLVSYNKISRTLTPLQNDTIGNTHGAFVIPNEATILAHSDRGGHPSLWKFPLNGEEPEEIVIETIQIKAHATISQQGIMTFDSLENVNERKT